MKIVLGIIMIAVLVALCVLAVALWWWMGAQGFEDYTPKDKHKTPRK